jgi:pyroglutamyl-peptidase
MSGVLCTGFEPFGKFPSNPSFDALELAQSRGLLPAGTAIARIPVRWDGAVASLQAAAEQHRPRAIVCFGLHGGLAGREANAIYLELTARNRDGAAKADNAGITRELTAIEPGGPDTAPATLDMAAIHDALSRAGFEPRFSDDAGAYLCNHLFYRGARLYAAQFPFGFVHVPPVQEIGGVLSLEQLARAVAIIVESAAKQAAIQASQVGTS